MSALPYVFIIGFNKTATTSLHKFFELNGWPAVHWDGGRLARTMLANCITGKRVFAGYDDRFRVYSDLTFRTSRMRFEGNSLFRVMDADYPGAFFVYNTRDLKGWLESRARHGSVVDGERLVEFEMRLMKTNDVGVVFDKWARERLAFEADIRQHFAGRPHLLEIDVFDADAPAKIAAHVGVAMDGAHWARHNETVR